MEQLSRLRGEYGRCIIEDHHAKLRQTVRGINAELPRIRPIPRRLAPVSVGILGAGVSGFYAALILQWLKDHHNLNITYEILEANPDRVGGRLHTVPLVSPDGSHTENDYYDAGAMRFPNNPFMDRTFDLFNKLNIKDAPVGSPPPAGSLIPYILSAKDGQGVGTNIMYVNGSRMTTGEYDAALGAGNYDAFKTGVYLSNSTGGLLEDKIGEIKAKLATDFKKYWKELMELDSWSTRGYMLLKDPKYDPQVVSLIETFNTGSNLFDQAMSETVLDDLTFDFPVEGGVQWKCIQGGAQAITDRLAAQMPEGTVTKDQRAVAIKPIGEITNPSSLEVTFVSSRKKIAPVTRNFDHVISTMPLSCFRMLDSSACKLPWDLQTALRTLNYDSSVKVAIKFDQRWWENPSLVQLGPQLGGASSTDRPTRVVVYPSYGIGTEASTMIVSYTWSQDAQRLGALAKGEDSEQEQLMLNIICRDLQDIHQLPADFNLRDKITAWHVTDWYSDENACGAFALFGPAQFSSLYKEVTKPALGRLHWAGEATSVHHAWVVGSLNSAYRCVLEMLEAEGHENLVDLLEDPANGWAFPNSDETLPELVKQQVALGEHPDFGKE